MLCTLTLYRSFIAIDITIIFLSFQKKYRKKKVYSCQNQYRWAFGYLRATPTLTKGVKSQQIVRSGQIYIYIYANFLSIHQGIIPVVVILNM